VKPAWHLYVVRARDGTLYTGIATDVDRRIAEHEANRGSKYLRGRGPLEVAFRSEIGDHELALRVERRFKGLSKPVKEQIVRARPRPSRLLALLSIEAGDG
jgi:putative endonuclease